MYSNFCWCYARRTSSSSSSSSYRNDLLISFSAICTTINHTSTSSPQYQLQQRSAIYGFALFSPFTQIKLIRLWTHNHAWSVCVRAFRYECVCFFGPCTKKGAQKIPSSFGFVVVDVVVGSLDTQTQTQFQSLSFSYSLLSLTVYRSALFLFGFVCMFGAIVVIVAVHCLFKNKSLPLCTHAHSLTHSTLLLTFFLTFRFDITHHLCTHSFALCVCRFASFFMLSSHFHSFSWAPNFRFTSFFFIFIFIAWSRN